MNDRLILGLTETITLKGNKEHTTIARIDTGATSSSLDKELAEKLGFETIVRLATVKSASGTKERPVVKAKVVLKGIEVEEEFTLADRGHMTYEVLIGQNILTKGDFLIDPNKGEEQ